MACRKTNIMRIATQLIIIHIQTSIITQATHLSVLAKPSSEKYNRVSSELPTNSISKLNRFASKINLEQNKVRTTEFISIGSKRISKRRMSIQKLSLY